MLIEARADVFRFLEQPSTKPSIAYHSLVFLSIIVSLIFSILLTVSPFDKDVSLVGMAVIYELCLLCIFLLECLLRIWSCGSVARFQGCMGKLRFMVNFIMLIDMISIAATIAAISPYRFHDPKAHFELIILRVARGLQIFRIMRIDRERGDFRTMVRLILRHNKELFTSYYIGFIVLVLSTFCVYVAEKELSNDPGKISNLADSLYWGLITVTTVGYGDFSPKGWLAKLITCVFALVGSSLFAIPVGIISSGFAIEVAKERRRRQQKSLAEPAAKYIQCWWKRKMALRQYNDFVHLAIPKTSLSGRLPSLSSFRIKRIVSKASPDALLQKLENGTENSEVAAWPSRNEHLAFLFYRILKENASLCSFERSKKPFIQLDDVISLIQRTEFRVARRLDSIENHLAKKATDAKIESLMRSVNALEVQLKAVALKRSSKN